MRKLESSRNWNWVDLRRIAVTSAAGVLGSRQDAEDAAQEALVRAWRAQATCHATPAPWLRRIARNEALRLAASLSERQLLEAPGVNPAEMHRTEPERGPAPAAGNDRLTAALQELPDTDRDLIRLRYVNDLQYSTIAEQLELPLGTVKVRLHRLHTHLRKAAAQ